MNEEQKRAAYNAVVGALITLGVTNRDALYAAEAAVQCLSNWDAQLLSHAAAEQRRIDTEDRAGYLTEREAYTRRLRADISPEEAAEELTGDPDEDPADEATERNRLINIIGNLMINAMPVVS